MVSSFLQNNLLEVPSKSFYRTAILPKFHLTLPKSFFVLTWRFANPYVGIFSSQCGWDIFVPSVWDDHSELFTLLVVGC